MSVSVGRAVDEERERERVLEERVLEGRVVEVERVSDEVLSALSVLEDRLGTLEAELDTADERLD